jgi:hypothetical protein
MRCRHLRMYGAPIQSMFRPAANLWAGPKGVFILAGRRSTFRGSPPPLIPWSLLSLFDPFLHTLQPCPRCQGLRRQYGAVPIILAANVVTSYGSADRRSYCSVPTAIMPPHFTKAHRQTPFGKLLRRIKGMSGRARISSSPCGDHLLVLRQFGARTAAGGRNLRPVRSIQRLYLGEYG